MEPLMSFWTPRTIFMNIYIHMMSVRFFLSYNEIYKQENDSFQRKFRVADKLHFRGPALFYMM